MPCSVIPSQHDFRFFLLIQLQKHLTSNHNGSLIRVRPNPRSLLNHQRISHCDGDMTLSDFKSSCSGPYMHVDRMIDSASSRVSALIHPDPGSGLLVAGSPTYWDRKCLACYVKESYLRNVYKFGSSQYYFIRYQARNNTFKKSKGYDSYFWAPAGSLRSARSIRHISTSVKY